MSFRVNLINVLESLGEVHYLGFFNNALHAFFL